MASSLPRLVQPGLSTHQPSRLQDGLRHQRRHRQRRRHRRRQVKQPSNPRLADPSQVCYSHVCASPWTAAATAATAAGAAGAKGGGGAKGSGGVKGRGSKPAAAAAAAARRVELVPELPAVVKSRRQVLGGYPYSYPYP